MTEAIQREKQLKKWNRAWKLSLIEGKNPEWRDLWSTIADEHVVDSGSPDRRVRGNDGEGSKR